MDSVVPTEADFLLEWTESLKVEINELPFKENDIRKDFFGLLYDIGYSFYRCYLLLDFAHFINQKQIAFHEAIEGYDKHVDRLRETTMHPTLLQGHTNSLNRNLLISAWSNFELCTTVLCDAIASEEEREKLLSHQYRDTLKALKNSTIDENDREKLKKVAMKHHLTHVPIVRKTDFLFTKANHYGGNLEQDKEFLKFLGKLRNTVHTNFIYYGKDYEYKFGQAHFVFRDQQLVVWADPFDGTPRLFFHFMTRLKEIWKSIITAINHPDLIPYPDPNQQ